VSNRVVIKFGGADLATGDKVAQAAGMVADASYKEIIVVVSAMGKTTDILLNTTSQIGVVSEPDYAELISMGERVSARFFCSALRARGAKAEFFDPCNDNWPLMTDSNFRNAKPDMEKTAARARKFIVPLLSDTIAVVCGFAGKGSENCV
jgi:aspartate kinase